MPAIIQGETQLRNFRIEIAITGNNSGAYSSTSLKFGKQFVHVTADTLQTVKVKGQGHSVTLPISSKNVISQEWIGRWLNSNLVIVPVARK